MSNIGQIMYMRRARKDGLVVSSIHIAQSVFIGVRVNYSGTLCAFLGVLPQVNLECTVHKASICK